MDRRTFNKNIGLVSGLIATGALEACSPAGEKGDQAAEQTDTTSAKVTPELSQLMYDKALAITKSKIRGGDSEKYFKKPFIDAAFNKNIFAPDLVSYGMPAKRDFCGWTALIPISVYKEYIV